MTHRAVKIVRGVYGDVSSVTVYDDGHGWTVAIAEYGGFDITHELDGRAVSDWLWVLPKHLPWSTIQLYLSEVMPEPVARQVVSAWLSPPPVKPPLRLLRGGAA